MLFTNVTFIKAPRQRKIKRQIYLTFLDKTRQQLNETILRKKNSWIFNRIKENNFDFKFLGVVYVF